MKKIIVLLFTIINMSCFSQTNLDSAVFNKINDYRVSNGLTTLVWDSSCFKSSDFHSKWLSTNSKIGHVEDNMISPIDRVRYFGSMKILSCGEVVQCSNENFSDTDINIIDKMSSMILDKWKNSISHNKELLDPSFKFAGIHCEIIKKETGINGIESYLDYSTMDLITKR